MADKQQTAGTSPAFYFLTGVFLLLLCTAVSAAALIKPYEKAKTYLNIVFMDSMKIAPSTGLDGLVIKENDIPSGPAASEQLSDEGEVIRPAFGEQYASLECKERSIQAPVYWGSTTELLDRGACQSTSSKVIGETGNVVIDAHVNTFFANLSQMEIGDTVTLYTTYGIFTYQVTELVTFQNTDKTYVLPTETDRLTLYTCEAQVLGTSSTRVGVLCEPVSKQYYVQSSADGGTAE